MGRLFSQLVRLVNSPLIFAYRARGNEDASYFTRALLEGWHWYWDGLEKFPDLYTFGQKVVCA